MLKFSKKEICFQEKKNLKQNEESDEIFGNALFVEMESSKLIDQLFNKHVHKTLPKTFTRVHNEWGCSFNLGPGIQLLSCWGQSSYASSVGLSLYITKANYSS
jgi:hypothetical protein